MKRVLLIVMGCCTLLTGAAQETRYTLNQAWEKALEQRVEIANQRLGVEIAAKDEEILATRRKPVISGSGDLRYNPVLQTSIIPGAAFENNGQPGMDREVRFGTRFSFLLNVEGSLSLIDPVYQTDRQLRQLSRQVAELGVNQTTEDIKLSVAQAYYEALLHQEAWQLAREDWQRAQDIMEVAEVRAANGTLLPSELDRFRLDVNKAQLAMESEEANYQLAAQRLAYEIGMEPGQRIFPSETLEKVAASLGEVSLPTGEDLNGRAEILQEGLRQQISVLGQEREAKLYRPTLDLYAALNAQHLSNDLAVWQKWYPFAFVGLRANLPIYDGKLKERNQERLGLEALTHVRKQEELQRNYDFNLREVLTTLQQAQRDILLGRENVRLAQQLLDRDQVAYQNGTLGYTEWRNSQFALRDAQQQQLQHYYDFLEARIRYLRIGGQL
ncbi:MAG: TolC family protein [Lewinellaceae bacterium]|nr:TolC family protein [Lewinellaceae bacterium]